MKTRIISIMLVLAFTATTLTANALNPVVGNPQKDAKQLRKKIANFLFYPFSKKDGLSDEKVKIIFTINQDSKIELLNVISKNEDYVNHVRKILQGKKIDVSQELIGCKYSVNITFKDFDQLNMNIH